MINFNPVIQKYKIQILNTEYLFANIMCHESSTMDHNVHLDFRISDERINTR